MTAPWRRLRSLVWEYWAGLLVCAFWIPDSRGMPHVIRIGKCSPEPGVSVRPGGGGNGGPMNAIPRDFPDLSGLPGPGDHRELVPVRTKFQSRGYGALLSRREAAGPRRARGPWRARERPDLAESSEAFQPQPEWRAHFPATASMTGRRPSSGTRLLRGAGTLGKAPTSLPSWLPAGPSPPPGERLQRPRRGRGRRLRRTGALDLLSRRPPTASGGPHPARRLRAEEGHPPTPRRSLLRSLEAGGKGATEPAHRGQEGGGRDASGF